MCGIAGIVSPSGVDWQALDRMSQALRHRGPDGHGFAAYSSVAGLQVVHDGKATEVVTPTSVAAIAHRRLAIIDRSAENAQPFVDDDKTLALSYNGELYNYQELRSELRSLGHAFRTEGDTEVVLRAYQVWGPDCVRRFNGMWAFALLDVARRVVILSRDRFGIKPLFYAVREGAVYFASEIKALLTVPSLLGGPNRSVVARYLRDGVVDSTQETFFAGIRQFPAAHWAVVPLRAGATNVRPVPYWTIPAEEYDGREPAAIDEFRSLFLDALRVHSQSDVPVGTCLSGGLDSSTIVSGMESLRAKGAVPSYQHSAFGYCSAEDRFSERRYMDAVAEQTGARLFHVEVSEGAFLQHVRSVIASQDEPFGSASIMAQWFVFQRARAEGITVMLDGQGADEVLGGYHKYFTNVAVGLLQRRRLAEFLRLRSDYERDVGPFPLPARLAAWALAPRALRGALRKAGSRVPDGSLLSWVVQPALTSHLPNGRPTDRDLGSLRAELALDVQSRNLPALLRYEDRNSMAHSVEARVPFLDHRVVELAFRLSDSMKIRGTTTKFLLRQAFGSALPAVVIERRDKIGFRAAPTLTSTILERDRVELERNETDYEREWFNPDWLNSLATRCAESADAEFLAWRSVNLKYWLRQHWGSGCG